MIKTSQWQVQRTPILHRRNSILWRNGSNYCSQLCKHFTTGSKFWEEMNRPCSQDISGMKKKRYKWNREPLEQVTYGEALSKQCLPCKWMWGGRREIPTSHLPLIPSVLFWIKTHVPWVLLAPSQAQILTAGDKSKPKAWMVSFHILTYNAEETLEARKDLQTAELVQKWSCCWPLAESPLLSLPRKLNLPFYPVTAQQRTCCQYICGKEDSKGKYLICPLEMAYWLPFLLSDFMPVSLPRECRLRELSFVSNHDKTTKNCTFTCKDVCCPWFISSFKHSCNVQLCLSSQGSPYPQVLIFTLQPQECWMECRIFLDTFLVTAGPRMGNWIKLSQSIFSSKICCYCGFVLNA